MAAAGGNRRERSATGVQPARLCGRLQRIIGIKTLQVDGLTDNGATTSGGSSAGNLAEEIVSSALCGIEPKATARFPAAGNRSGPVQHRRPDESTGGVPGRRCARRDREVERRLRLRPLRGLPRFREREFVCPGSSACSLQPAAPPGLAGQRLRHHVAASTIIAAKPASASAGIEKPWSAHSPVPVVIARRMSSSGKTSIR